MQIISDDKTVRSNTVQGVKFFNSQSLVTQAKTGEHLVFLFPAIKSAFNLMGDDIVELSTENETLKSQIDFCDEKWLEGSIAKPLKQIGGETRANLILSRMENS